MTEAPKKMCDTCGAPVTQNAHGEISYDRAEVQRLVAEARAGSVFVKPLVWEEPRWGNAYSKCGLYKAHKEYGSTSYYVTWGRLILRDDMGRTNWFGSLDAAKDAAQADYERRILSALSDAPPRQWLANCCICKRIVDTREEADGGDPHGCEVQDGQWVCSGDCWDVAVGDAPRQVTPQEAAKVVADWIDSDMVSANQLINSIEGVTMETPLRHWLSQCVRALANGGDD